MTKKEKEVEAKLIADLERKIVRVDYDQKVSTKRDDKKVDTTKILTLAKKIRESYDYNDAALDGAQ